MCAVAIADEVEEVQTCAICHGALRHSFQRRLVMPKRLPCGHVFHLGCVRRWMIHSLGKEASCPMCRLQLPNALEAGTTDCWQTKALAGIRWWLEWPKQHAVSVRTPQLPASLCPRDPVYAEMHCCCTRGVQRIAPGRLNRSLLRTARGTFAPERCQIMCTRMAVCPVMAQSL